MAFTNFSRAQLQVVTFKGSLGKARQELGTGNLSSAPYLNVQILSVSGVVTLHSVEAATQNDCFLITIDPVTPRHYSLGKIMGTVLSDGDIKSHWHGFGHPMDETFEQNKNANQQYQ